MTWVVTLTARVQPFLFDRFDDDEGEIFRRAGLEPPPEYRRAYQDLLRGEHRRAMDHINASREILALHYAVLNSTISEASPGYPKAVCPTCSDNHGVGPVGQVLVPCPTVRLLALPYAEHPEYQDALRP